MSIPTLIQAIVAGKIKDAQRVFDVLAEQRIARQLVKESQDVAKTVLEPVNESMPMSDVQRVFDEIGDVRETELLCGVRNLRINTQGDVVSFTRLMSEDAKMPFEDALAKQEQLEQAVKDTGVALKAFKRNAIGLPSEEDRTSKSYQDAKKLSDMAFQALRQYNSWFVKTYAQELKDMRRNRK